MTEQDPISEQKGLVISYFGNTVAVEAENGQVFQCHLRRNQTLPVVGDDVFFTRETSEAGIILRIAERRSFLARGDNRGNSKAIVANIDAIVIVMAPPPILSEYLIDRYLVAAALLDLNAIVVLNKMDLLTENDKETVLKRLLHYQQLDYPVILSSTLTQTGLRDLSLKLKDKTAVLVGPTGVGKSSIIAKLSQEAANTIRVGELSAKGSGKHTTTATRLYHLTAGGRLIDSPGVREFNLWKVNQQDILRGFREIARMNGCKFRDCLHLVEPDCAVQAAASGGKISEERFANYQKLMKEASRSR